MTATREPSDDSTEIAMTRPNLAQHDETIWSFGASRRRLVGPPSRPIVDAPKAIAANENGALTMGPQKVEPPAPPAVSISPQDFGRRRFQVLSEWEGVVDEINGTKFRCRLLPIEDGRANSARVEFTEFDLDDLASDSDIKLVRPGAVFYWTVGRSQNAAGTRTNVSLVRFRRIPPPDSNRRRRARREADHILRHIGEPENGHSPGH